MEDQYRIKLSDTIDMVVTYYFDQGEDGTYNTPPDGMEFIILHVSLWQKNRDSYDHIQITDVDDHWLAWNEKAIETEILKLYTNRLFHIPYCFRISVSIAFSFHASH